MQNLPKYAKAVIIGGGVIGTSAAYHLSRDIGFKDTVLLEQGSLTCGTTWHAAGLIGQMRSTSSEIKLSKYGCQLLQQLEDEGYSTGWQKSGSLSLSSTPDRLIHLKRNLTRAKAFNIEAELLSPDEALDKWPYFDKTDINGALWFPNDGSAISTDLTMALSQAAKKNGTRIYENTQVTGLKFENSVTGLKKIKGVKTQYGDIDAEVVVICAGLWSPHLYEELTIPLHPCYHMYVVTEACGIPKELPILRDLNGLLYAREWCGGLCVGGFELNAKPCFVNQKPEKLEYHLFPEDYEHFDPILQNAMNRIPFMRTSGIRQFINGPESFTIDNSYIFGEAPDIKNLYMACGFNSSGIASSGGVGHALYELIVHGKNSMDLWSVDSRRFAKFQKSNKFLQERVSETVGFHYSIPWPLREYETGRGIRRSPLYEVLKNKNAFFGNNFGWERVNCFLEKGFNISEALKSWELNEKLNEQIRAEHLHTRSKVSLFDLTSSSKYLIQGQDALKTVDYLFCGFHCMMGKISYTGMLNEDGGYEADVKVIYVSDNEFLVISATASATRDMTWIKNIINKNNFRSSVTDITSSYSLLGIMGPNSRILLESILENDEVSKEKLQLNYSKEIALGMANIRVNRICDVGTLGFELLSNQ